jgi:chorismate mutase
MWSPWDTGIPAPYRRGDFLLAARHRRSSPCHDDGVTPDHAGDGDLDDIRARLDVVDRRLVEVLAQRRALIHEVIEFKRARGMAVVDRAREDAMLDRIETMAAALGLDPRIARQVLRAVIDAFTLMEVEELGDP